MDALCTQLQSLGLSSNEASIYTFLLSHPNCTTGPIIKETRIANSRVYGSLHALIDRGLATYSIHVDGKRYCAVSPDVFLQKEDDRRKSIEQLVPQLKGLQGSSSLDTTTAVFEGFEGFKTAFKKIIDDCPIDGVISITGFSSQMYAEKSLRVFLQNMNLKSAKKRQRLHILLDESTRKTQGRDRAREKNTKVRYMRPGYISPAAIDVFDDYVYIFLWDQKPFVFMIRNAAIAASFQMYFDLLWKMAKA